MRGTQRTQQPQMRPAPSRPHPGSCWMRSRPITTRFARSLVERNVGSRRETGQALRQTPPSVWRCTASASQWAMETLSLGLAAPKTAKTWIMLKAAFANATRERADAEIADTFFNSVARRMQGTVGADPRTTFVEPSAPPRTREPRRPVRHAARAGAGRGRLRSDPRAVSVERAVRRRARRRRRAPRESSPRISCHDVGVRPTASR